MSKQFREFTQPKGRERWPLAFDLQGVLRDTTTRKQLQEQLTYEDQEMRATTTNHFASSKMIDINNPPKPAYNPRDPANEFPKMLFHQTEKHPLELAEFKRITKFNALHPDKPEILPPVGAKYIIVKDKAEQDRMLSRGYGLRAPNIETESTEENAVDDSGAVLCSRGCGKEPHPGRCARQPEAVAV